jgi:hypothetical protein
MFSVSESWFSVVVEIKVKMPKSDDNFNFKIPNSYQ